MIIGTFTFFSVFTDHWSATLTYWWIGLSMIAVTIFVIYNGVIALALLPPNNLRPARPRTLNIIENTYNNHSTLPDIFMHVFIDSNDKVDLNKYMPHLEIISEKHHNFNYNLIIVINDTTSITNALSAEVNNEIAFNSLWAKEHIYENPKTNKRNIKIKYTSLSKYLDESPLKNDWKILPYHFIEFLVRAISVWDKGGIAVNPIILTPRSPHVIYIEKLKTILQKYEKIDDTKSSELKTKTTSFKDKQKSKKKVNNIRDIIDILEGEDNAYNNNFTDENLSETEDRENVVVAKNERTLRSTGSKVKSDFAESVHYSVTHNKLQSLSKVNDTEQLGEKQYFERLNKHHEVQNSKNVHENHNALQLQPTDINDPSRFSLLPLFLEFLFHDKTKFHKLHMPPENVTRYRKSVLPIEHLKQNTTAAENKTIVTNKTEIKETSNYKPMIISARGIVTDDLAKKEVNGILNKHDNNNYELTIDLGGNIIATKTACHAFIGTLFNDVAHRTTQETVKDFIIAELSYFCKGLLSSCKGIDVILL